MMMRNIMIIIVLLLAGGCNQETVREIEPDVKYAVRLNFETISVLQEELSTRTGASQSVPAVDALSKVYIYVYDQSGEKVYEKQMSSIELKKNNSVVNFKLSAGNFQLCVVGVGHTSFYTDSRSEFSLYEGKDVVKALERNTLKDEYFYFSRPIEIVSVVGELKEQITLERLVGVLEMNVTSQSATAIAQVTVSFDRGAVNNTFVIKDGNCLLVNEPADGATKDRVEMIVRNPSDRIVLGVLPVAGKTFNGMVEFRYKEQGMNRYKTVFFPDITIRKNCKTKLTVVLN